MIKLESENKRLKTSVEFYKRQTWDSAQAYNLLNGNIKEIEKQRDRALKALKTEKRCHYCYHEVCCFGASLCIYCQKYVCSCCYRMCRYVGPNHKQNCYNKICRYCEPNLCPEHDEGISGELKEELMKYYSEHDHYGNPEWSSEDSE